MARGNSLHRPRARSIGADLDRVATRTVTRLHRPCCLPLAPRPSPCHQLRGTARSRLARPARCASRQRPDSADPARALKMLEKCVCGQAVTDRGPMSIAGVVGGMSASFGPTQRLPRINDRHSDILGDRLKAVKHDMTVPPPAHPIAFGRERPHTSVDFEAHWNIERHDRSSMTRAFSGHRVQELLGGRPHPLDCGLLLARRGTIRPQLTRHVSGRRLNQPNQASRL